MESNPATLNTVLQTVEQLDYRVTVGDVAAQAGLQVETARQGLLSLAADVGGHLQVAETGDIAYVFPNDLRGILRRQSWRLRWQEWRDRSWGILFYLIRISFGIILIASIALVFITIFVLLTTASQSKDDRDGGSVAMPPMRIDPIWFYILFDPRYSSRGYGRGYNRRRSFGGFGNDYPSPKPPPRPAKPAGSGSDLNFLEAVFSFLFGDAIPNLDLEEKRWQAIGATIRNQGGATTAEQMAPYLDEIKTNDDEDYMLPVLLRFNGEPAVSPTGELVYRFPELQVSAEQSRPVPVSAYLKEEPWQFSSASGGQLGLAAGLGVVNIVGIAILAGLLADPQIAEVVGTQIDGGLAGVTMAIFGFLAAYGIGYFVIPGVRYLWIQRRNAKIATRNNRRQARAERLLDPDPALQEKISFAKQFAASSVVSADDLAYTSERSLLDQDIDNQAKLDAEWQRRLEEGTT